MHIWANDSRRKLRLECSGYRPRVDCLSLGVSELIKLVNCNSGDFRSGHFRKWQRDLRRQHCHREQASIYLPSPFAFFGLFPFFSRMTWQLVRPRLVWRDAEAAEQKHKRLCTRKSCCKCLGKAHTLVSHARDVALIGALWIRQTPTQRPRPRGTRPCLARMATGSTIMTLSCAVVPFTPSLPAPHAGRPEHTRIHGGCGGHRSHPKTSGHHRESIHVHIH